MRSMFLCPNHKVCSQFLKRVQFSPVTLKMGSNVDIVVYWVAAVSGAAGFLWTCMVLFWYIVVVVSSVYVR